MYFRHGSFWLLANPSCCDGSSALSNSNPLLFFQYITSPVCTRVKGHRLFWMTRFVERLFPSAGPIDPFGVFSGLGVVPGWPPSYFVPEIDVVGVELFCMPIGLFQTGFVALAHFLLRSTLPFYNFGMHHPPRFGDGVPWQAGFVLGETIALPGCFYDGAGPVLECLVAPFVSAFAFPLAAEEAWGLWCWGRGAWQDWVSVNLE